MELLCSVFPHILHEFKNLRSQRHIQHPVKDLRSSIFVRKPLTVFQKSSIFIKCLTLFWIRFIACKSSYSVRIPENIKIEMKVFIAICFTHCSEQAKSVFCMFLRTDIWIYQKQAKSCSMWIKEHVTHFDLSLISNISMSIVFWNQALIGKKDLT